MDLLGEIKGLSAKRFMGASVWIFCCCTWEFFLFPATYEVVCSPSRKWVVRGERKRDMRGYFKNIYIKLKDYFNKRSCKIKSGMWGVYKKGYVK